MANRTLRVSAVIPTVNHGRYVGEAFRSILDRSYRGLDMVVIGSPTTALVPRAYLSEICGLDVRCRICADWELWIRIAGRHEPHYASAPSVKHRVKAGLRAETDAGETGTRS